MYVAGVRQGWGVVSSPASDILALTGDWDRGWLEAGSIFCQLKILMIGCEQNTYFSPAY